MVDQLGNVKIKEQLRDEYEQEEQDERRAWKEEKMLSSSDGHEGHGYEDAGREEKDERDLKSKRRVLVGRLANELTLGRSSEESGGMYMTP